MKKIDHALDRLFRCARRTPDEFLAPPFGFDRRILAGWRQMQLEDESQWMLSLLRRAFLAACGVALLSVALSYRPLPELNPDEFIFTDSLIRMRLLP